MRMPTWTGTSQRCDATNASAPAKRWLPTSERRPVFDVRLARVDLGVAEPRPRRRHRGIAGRVDVRDDERVVGRAARLVNVGAGLADHGDADRLDEHERRGGLVATEYRLRRARDEERIKERPAGADRRVERIRRNGGQRPDGFSRGRRVGALPKPARRRRERRDGGCGDHAAPEIRDRQ